MAQQSIEAGFWKRNQKTLAPWLFMAPGIVMFLVYVIVPIFQSIWISFYEWDGLGPKSWVGLGNYADLLNDDSFYTSLSNNLIWLVLYLLASPGGLAVALFLNQTVAGIRLYKSLFFFPFVISQVVVGLIFTWFYAPDFGLLPIIIQALTGSDVAVLADERYATYGVIAAGLWPQTAYCMILYLTGLNNINSEQVEAALKLAEEIKAHQKDRIQGAERPQHRVVITKPFLLGATEVTIGQFRKFLRRAIHNSGTDR